MDIFLKNVMNFALQVFYGILTIVQFLPYMQPRQTSHTVWWVKTITYIKHKGSHYSKI